jgi:AbrB family looped-hinge helix DNA binding protein
MVLHSIGGITATTRVTKKYQTTIPAEVREVLGVKPGQEVEWYVVKDRVVLEAPKRVKEPAKFLTGQIKLDIDAVKLVREAREELG